MTDTATKAENEKPKHTIAPVSVTRNNITKVFTQQEEAKGPTQGEPFLWVNVDEMSLQELADFSDPVWVKNRVARILKKEFKSIYKGAIDEDSGIFDSTKFVVDATNYKFFSESIKTLTEELAKLIRSFAAVDMSTPEGFEKTKEMKIRMKNLQMAIDNKKRPSDDSDDEDEDTTPAPVKAAPVVAHPVHAHKA